MDEKGPLDASRNFITSPSGKYVYVIKYKYGTNIMYA